MLIKIKKARNQECYPLFLAFVGITGLEPATSRPPDVCATNCAKSRLLSFQIASAKVLLYFETNKYFSIFFLRKYR